MVGIYKLYGAFKNKFQLGIGVRIFLKQELVHLHELHFLIDHPYKAKAHNGSPGIDTQYYLFICQERRYLIFVVLLSNVKYVLSLNLGLSR